MAVYRLSQHQCYHSGAEIESTETGNAWKSEKNPAGVATTETSAGGEAKTKNGKGVYKSPSGKKCVKTANNQGCK
jgi:hypothetical protein